MTRTSLFGLAMITCLVAGAGCSSSTEDEPAPTPACSCLAGSGGAGGQPNRAPVWNAAPKQVDAKEGRTTTVPLAVTDDDGDTVISTVTAPTGFVATTKDKGIALAAPYDATGGTLSVHLDDAHGGTVDQTVTVTAPRLAWGKTIAWTDGGPEAREHGVFLVDPARDRAILLGGSGYKPQGTPLGDAWAFSLETRTWSALTLAGDPLPPGGSRRAAPIRDEPAAFLWGGYGDKSTDFNDLYRVDHGADVPEVKVVPQADPRPPKRSLHAFAYDATTQRFFVFGGAGVGVLGDTWVGKLIDGVVTWEKLALSPSPSPRYGFFSAVDEQRGRMLVYAGAQSFSPLNPARDLWALDLRATPPAWSLIAQGDDVPPGRRNGCAVFDPLGPRLYVWGGTADGMKSEKGLFVFDAREGHDTFTQLTRDAEPVIRSSGFGFYDPKRDEVLFGFGNDASVYRDLTPLGYPSGS